MDRTTLTDLLAGFTEKSPTNFLQPKITEEEAERQMQADADRNLFRKNNYFGKGKFNPAVYNKDKDDRYIGMQFFRAPVLSFGSASDPGYLLLKKSGVVGPHHKLPTDWLPDAKTVISLFLPYSDRVLESNIADPEQPSLEWMFTRIDGQNHLLGAGALVAEALRKEGYDAVVPQADERYFLQTSYRIGGEDTPFYTSNWSERHVGYVAGQGTFGLNTSLITRAGCAGRLISIVTNWEAEPDVKDYSGYLDYCIKCGVCIGRCPAGAIKEGCVKDHDVCSAYVGKVCAAYTPRYGCGKCQSSLPCQRKRP